MSATLVEPGGSSSIDASPVRAAAAWMPLVETAQVHQQMAEESLLRLSAHTAGLDAVVRDEIRRSFIAECGALVEEARLAGEALADLQRASRRYFRLSGLLSLAVSLGATLFFVTRWMPAPQEQGSLRAEQTALRASVAQLSALGGRIQLRRCGPERRLCARIDRSSPPYGAGADFFVLEGY